MTFADVLLPPLCRVYTRGQRPVHLPHTPHIRLCLRGEMNSADLHRDSRPSELRRVCLSSSRALAGATRLRDTSPAPPRSSEPRGREPPPEPPRRGSQPVIRPSPPHPRVPLANLGGPHTCPPTGRTGMDRQTRRQTEPGRQRRRGTCRYLMLMESVSPGEGGKARPPSPRSTGSGDGQMISLTSTRSLHFPHYWKQDTVICY